MLALKRPKHENSFPFLLFPPIQNGFFSRMFTLFYVVHQGFLEQHGFFYLDLVHMRIVHQRHPAWHVIKTVSYLRKDAILAEGWA